MSVWRGVIEEAPSSPGVYFFLGADRELLYVGKATDIRTRLRQHAKSNSMGGTSRRYDHVAEVRWEVHADESSATAREADLIVSLRPPFNANTREGRWAYIVIVGANERARFELKAVPGTRDSYGCFPHLGKGVCLKPAIACSDGYTALLRLLWAASGEGSHTPASITRSAPGVFDVALEPALRKSLHTFLDGRGKKLLSELRPLWNRRERYMHPALERDQQVAENFFVHGPRAVRALRAKRGGRDRLISKEEIEELMASEVRAIVERDR